MQVNLPEFSENALMPAALPGLACNWHRPPWSRQLWRPLSRISRDSVRSLHHTEGRSRTASLDHPANPGRPGMLPHER